MRRAAKRDDNEPEVIAYWRRVGCWVETSSERGRPDTRVYFGKGTSYRAEVKGAKNGLTQAQVENFTDAYKHGVPTYVVRTIADAGRLLEGSLAPWEPKDGALAGAARKERPFRPGKDRARTIAESCTRDGCATSRSPGFMECAAHAAEAFAPPEKG